MNLDKSTKRIAKRVKKGFQGYPQISLAYFGESAYCAIEVVISFISEEGAIAQEQKFTSVFRHFTAGLGMLALAVTFRLVSPVRVMPVQITLQ